MIRRILILGTLLAACSSPTWLDEGLMVRDGVELHIDRAPLDVRIEGALDDPSIVPEAIAWWNNETGIELFRYTTEIPADVTIQQGLVPGDIDDGEELDVTTVNYNRRSGLIIGAGVMLSADHAYDRPTMLHVLRHALGHSVGLKNDPGPPMTVDLRSVMSCPLDPLGELTPHDLAIVLGMLEGE